MTRYDMADAIRNVITEQREEITGLKAEVAKLLKELEAEHALAEALGHYHEDAKSENAKLREYAPEATLGRGTCKADKLCDGYLYYTSYWCRGCGERFAYRPIGGKDRGASPKFCPNCGAKFVGPTTNDVDAEVTDG